VQIAVWVRRGWGGVWRKVLKTHPYPGGQANSLMQAHRASPKYMAVDHAEMVGDNIRRGVPPYKKKLRIPEERSVYRKKGARNFGGARLA